jgi:hypothetical protein
VRCDEEGTGPNEEQLEEDEYVVLLGCQRAAGIGDGGGDDDISNLGAPFWMPSMMGSMVRPGTPQKRRRPSLFQLFHRPMRPAVLFISMSCCAWK